jgi:hypothetical protein
MHPWANLLRGSQDVVLKAARSSQALVILAVDRLSRDEDSERPRALGRLWGVQLDLAELVFGDAAGVTDQAYVGLKRALALHQEFAQRLLEAVDTRDITPAPPARDTNVIDLRPWQLVRSRASP